MSKMLIAALAAVGIAVATVPADAGIFGGKRGLIRGDVGKVFRPAEQVVRQVPGQIAKVLRPQPSDNGPRTPCNTNPKGCMQ